MCGDLHTLYKSNNVPITKFIIEKYLLEQTASKLYWRLFENNIDVVPIITPITKQIDTNQIDTNDKIDGRCIRTKGTIESYGQSQGRHGCYLGRYF